MTNREQYDSAWDELEQYRKIGTVEECRQAVEKQRPKEPKFAVDKSRDREDVVLYLACQGCGAMIDIFDNFCRKCGQAAR